jgi:hypothetical protein
MWLDLLVKQKQGTMLVSGALFVLFWYSSHLRLEVLVE